MGKLPILFEILHAVGYASTRSDTVFSNGVCGAARRQCNGNLSCNPHFVSTALGEADSSALMTWMGAASSHAKCRLQLLATATLTSAGFDLA